MAGRFVVEVVNSGEVAEMVFEAGLLDGFPVRAEFGISR